MGIKINSTSISEGFKGIVALGSIERLYVSGDGKRYQLYGTVFSEGRETVVIPPSESTVLTSGSIEFYLGTALSDRVKLSNELALLEATREDVINGRYDYGVSKELVEILTSISTNSLKPLPSLVIGGKLGYDQLLKNNDEVNNFEDIWERWSHVQNGLSKYDLSSDDSDLQGITDLENVNITNDSRVETPFDLTSTLINPLDEWGWDDLSMTWDGLSINTSTKTFHTGLARIGGIFNPKYNGTGTFDVVIFGHALYVTPPTDDSVALYSGTLSFTVVNGFDQYDCSIAISNNVTG